MICTRQFYVVPIKKYLVLDVSKYLYTYLSKVYFCCSAPSAQTSLVIRQFWWFYGLYIIAILRFPFSFSLLLLSSAAPLSNDAMLVDWTPEPKTRSTAGILFSCIATLGLCVWTALQLHIEPTGGKTKITLASRFFGKIICAFTALIAPELVLSIALHQFLVAWKYCSIVNDKKNGENGKDTAEEGILCCHGRFCSQDDRFEYPYS